MSSNGRYVRAPKYLNAEASEDEYESVLPEGATSLSDPGNDSSDENGDSDIPSDPVSTTGGQLSQDQDDDEPIANHHTTNSETNQIPVESGNRKAPSDTDERFRRMESVLANITETLHTMNTMRPIPVTDQDWCTQSTSSDVTLPTVRWDNIKPFPAGVPANKMWEEWNRYIENFEIAASLSNANDPVRRSQLLFLSIGDELQNIVRAAKLRPSLNDANCYRQFVANIKNHFQAMTDSAAEHEAFSNMRQDKNESSIAFHARLTAKVRLCGYSPTDQDRFVRAQLLKGLRNKELVKAARTYGHDTNYIVQAATRDEAYEAEVAVQPGSLDPYSVNRIQSQTTRQPPHRDSFRKRPGSESLMDRSQPKRFRGNQQAPRPDLQDRGRRTRCRRCNGVPHSNFTCPALNRNCNLCGERGHYAAACRQTRIRQVQVKANRSPSREDCYGHDQV